MGLLYLQPQQSYRTTTHHCRGLSNTPKLSPMEEGHEQPDSPEDSWRET